MDYISGDPASHIPVKNDAYIIDTAVGQRHSRDNTVDSRGLLDLLELCIANKLRITNGRTFGDTHGKFTCHNYAGSSMVDYFIVSEQLLNDILYVYVSDFLPLSDCHCKISLKLLSTFKRECTSMNMQEMPKRYKWDELSVTNFQNAFLHPTVQNDIQLFLDKSIEYNEQSINNATNEIHNIFNKVAKLSLHRKSAHRTSTHK